jgi:hypothetical protein
MRISSFCAVMVLAGALAHAQALPVEPLHDSGQNVTGAFEGWFQNQDGTYSLLLGYFNRNHKQELDIPIGPNNRIEPGGPDQGQPTHFLPSRQWGVFTVTVPKDFGTKKLTWTLAVNGKTTTIPMSLDALWEVQPFKEASGNTPPAMRFDEGAASVQGPRPITTALAAATGSPVALKVWVADDAKLIPGMRQPNFPAAFVTWSKFRGPGTVSFAKARPPVDTSTGQTAGAAFSGRATTTATFSEPGEYVLLVQANDWTGPGGAGFQCCWTNAMVKVTVGPAAK